MKHDIKLYLTPVDEPIEVDYTIDYSALNNIAMCPMYGITKYVLKKTMAVEAEAMALKAGAASHNFFAGVRLIQLYREGYKDHFEFHGQRLFKDSWPLIKSYVNDQDPIEWGQAFALECLYSSGFEDSEFDKKRTMSSIEAACLFYYDNWQWDKYPIWVKNPNDPTDLVGIEMMVDFIIEYPNGKRIRFKGQVDGLHVDHLDPTKVIVQENKTTSRITEDWKNAFDVSHQITGYTIYARLVTGQVIEHANVIALTIPIPKGDPNSGIAKVPVVRNEGSIESFIIWVDFHTNVIGVYKDNPTNIPMNSHSCNRYFRTCDFLPYCYSSPEDREYTFNNEMVENHWEVIDD